MKGLHMRNNKGYISNDWVILIFICSLVGIFMFLMIMIPTAKYNKANREAYNDGIYYYYMEIVYIDDNDPDSMIIYNHEAKTTYNIKFSDGFGVGQGFELRHERDWIEVNDLIKVEMHDNYTKDDYSDDVYIGFIRKNGHNFHQIPQPTPEPTPTLSPEEYRELRIQQEDEFNEIVGAAIAEFTDHNAEDSNAIGNSRLPSH